MKDAPSGPRPPRRPPGPTRREVVVGVASELEALGIEAPRVEAERLVAGILGVPRAELSTAAGERISPATAAAIARAVSRRLEGEPLQHIEGSVAFRRLTLVSDRRALVPRPETEQLVDRIAEWVGDRRPVARALDIGTGSGAIGLALLDEGLVDRVLGLDVSAMALEQAVENRDAAGLASRFEPRRCPPAIWPALEPGERFDLVVSNPPYVRSDEIDGLAPEVRDHEPREALDGGPDGLDVVRTIAAGAARHLRPRGALFLEIAPDAGDRVGRILSGAPGLGEVAIERDLSGRDRFARAVRRRAPGAAP